MKKSNKKETGEWVNITHLKKGDRFSFAERKGARWYVVEYVYNKRTYVVDIDYYSIFKGKKRTYSEEMIDDTKLYKLI